MARRFAYLTPDTNETQTIVSRCLSVPLPLLPHVVGALSELTNVWQWEQFGTMTPEDAAQLAAVMLNDFSEACDAMTCEEIIQCVLASGILQTVADDALKRVVDGVPQWSPDGVIWYDMPLAGDGSPNVPALQPTSGANDDAKICLAATRAVLVINELYGGVFGAVGNGLHTALNDFSRFLRELNHSLLGLLYGESWQIVNAAILQDVDVATHYVNPSLAETVLEEFLCLLVNNAAVDAAGIVTFDYGAVRANVVSETNLIDGTAIWGLLGYIGADGLNVAGSTHITNTPMDCSPCDPSSSWCILFDFYSNQSQLGWIVDSATCAMSNWYAPIWQFIAVHYCGPGQPVNRIKTNVNIGAADTVLTHVEVLATASGHLLGKSWELVARDVPTAYTVQASGWQGGELATPVSGPFQGFVGAVGSQNGAAAGLNISAVRLRGTGTKPIGGVDC